MRIFIVIEFRPHRIQVVSADGGGLDSEGCPIPSMPKYGEMLPCRYETEGKSTWIQLEDGTFKKYPYVVFMDVIEADFDNQVVRLFDENGNLVVERRVASFQRGQLRMRIWL